MDFSPWANGALRKCIGMPVADFGLRQDNPDCLHSLFNVKYLRGLTTEFPSAISYIRSRHEIHSASMAELLLILMGWINKHQKNAIE